MYHWGVSVVVEGGQDDQRGFTYSYGMANTTIRRQIGSGASVTRYPVLSIASRVMGVIEMSGNGSWNAISAANSSSITLTSANTTYDGVLSSSLTANFSTTSNVITVTSGSTANVFVGQYVTSATSGIPASATVTYVNSTAYIINATPTATATGATVNTYTQNSLVGRHIYFPAQGNNYGKETRTTPSTGVTGRITGSNSTVISFTDIVSNSSVANTSSLVGTPFQIGLINRGQLLPKTMFISADATCIVELITSTTQSPILLTGAAWNTLANITYTTTVAGNTQQATGLTAANGSTLNFGGLGSNYSFAMRDVSATALSGGEVVFAFTAPAGGSGLQVIDLSYFFPLYNTVAGNLTDVITVAVTTTGTSGSNVGVHIVGQEAMS
jgi:hypothetical protein